MGTGETERQPAPLSPWHAGSLHRWLRNLHLYAGLFISPYVLVFAVSVFFLVHAWLPGARTGSTREWSATDLPLATNLNELSGRERVNALRPALDRARVHGEVGWIQYLAKENRLVVPVTVPGRATTVTLDVAKREALIRERSTGLASALIELHRSPGPHLVGIRKNSSYLQMWSWLTDASVLHLLLVSLTGVYLWYVLRSERRVGIVLLAAGAFTFFGLVYALVP